MRKLALVSALALIFMLAACDTLDRLTQQATPTAMPTAIATEAVVVEPTALPEVEAPTEVPPTAVPAPDTGDMVIPELVGTVWEWTRFTTPVDTTEIADPTRYTIQFEDDGSAFIKADCNNVVATYTTDDTGAITIVPGPSTLAMCPEDSQDTLFVASLAAAARYFSYETDPNLFIDLTADSGTMTFRRGEAAAPQAPEEAETTGLTGTTWEWVTVIDPAGQTAIADPSRYTITFAEDGSAAVLADCNNVTATYIVDGASISIELGATTLMACPEDTQDQLFVNSLGRAGTYAIQDNELFLTMVGDSGTVILREAGSAAEAPAEEQGGPTLTGTTWQWQTLQTPVEQIVAADPARYTITFNDDGTAVVLADCNTATATYTLGEGNTITITLGAMTLVACPPDSQADVYLAGLGNAAIYSFDGDTLLLDMTADAGTLSFLPAPTAEAPAEAPAVTTLTGATWQWTFVGGPATTLYVTDPSRYLVTFNQDGSVNIKADCNNVLGTYTADESGAIAITLGPSTLAACPEDSQDTEFLTGLANATAYVVEQGMLALQISPDGTAMQFDAIDAGATGTIIKGQDSSTLPVAPPSGGLTGTTWAWNTLEQAGAVVTVTDPSRFTIVFNADGTANIQADCNMVQATWTSDGSSLSITPGASTMALCQGMLDQVFVGGLTNAMAYRVEGANLLIDMLYESGTMRFSAMP